MGTGDTRQTREHRAFLLPPSLYQGNPRAGTGAGVAVSTGRSFWGADGCDRTGRGFVSRAVPLVNFAQAGS